MSHLLNCCLHLPTPTGICFKSGKLLCCFWYFMGPCTYLGFKRYWKALCTQRNSPPQHRGWLPLLLGDLYCCYASTQPSNYHRGCKSKLHSNHQCCISCAKANLKAQVAWEWKQIIKPHRSFAQFVRFKCKNSSPQKEKNG